MKMNHLTRFVDSAIVGTGVQGLTLAAFLRQRDVVPLERMLLIDPNENPLAVLAERFRDCETVHLRSGVTDHCGCEELSLQAFAERNGRTDELMTEGNRPSVSLFVDHTRYIYDYHQLAGSTMRAFAAGIERDGDQLVLKVTDGRESGQVRTNCLHLCLGHMAPHYPNWARTNRGHDPRISHVFDRDYELHELPDGDTVIVVGGGITAGQVAGSIAEELGRKVLLITRRELTRGEGTTSSEDWKDPERRQHLCGLDWSERFELLRKEGDRGTMPPWEMERLQRLIDRGDLRHEVRDIALLVPQDDGVLLVDTNGNPLRGDATVLSTGMMPIVPDWLRFAARRLNLPFDDNGHPILQENLQWGTDHKIFLHGSFAKPVLGPYAPNVSGARIAGEIATRQFVC